MSKIKKPSEVSIDEKKRIVDFGLLEDDEAAALGNLTIVEMLLRELSQEGQDNAIDMGTFHQDACYRAADMLCDSYKLLRERMLQFAAKEGIEAGNIPKQEADNA
jgi:hypothetical protein